jgi:hypothetical protein
MFPGSSSKGGNKSGITFGIVRLRTKGHVVCFCFIILVTTSVV